MQSAGVSKLAIFRINLLRNQFSNIFTSGYCSSSNNTNKLIIGDVAKEISEPKNPELVPVNYVNSELDQSTLKKIRWMLQKDVIGQDMFLIGPPGPARLRLAYQYAELTNQEIEYVALSRDTTESDLKQRRELSKGTSFFVDQAAVRAAVSGRLLILDGIEKTERNVLPVLNNLLENREMPLEDGRLLIPAAKFDKLLKEADSADLENWKVLRVSEKFRVLALGVPVPKFPGNPLDPPLRSRFQALNVTSEQLAELKANIQMDEHKLMQLVSFAFAVNSTESSAQGLPYFPTENLRLAAELLSSFPELEVEDAIHQLYPFKTFLSVDGQKMAQSLIDSLKIGKSTKSLDPTTLIEQAKAANVPMGGATDGSVHSDYVSNGYHDLVSSQMVASHAVHDFCIVGPRGSGKTCLVKNFARTLNYRIEPIMLYQDMTSRDLLQHRTTMPNGDTVWRPAPLITAALEGKLAVLDGLHRMPPSNFSVLHNLVHEREVQLFDGSRLLRHDRYNLIKAKQGLSDEQMAAKGLYRIHPSFRIIGLAEPPAASGKTSSNWLTPEVLSLFLYHSTRALDSSEEVKVLEKLIGGKLPKPMKPVLELARRLRTSQDPTFQSLATSLSTRQLLRIGKRLHQFPGTEARRLVEQASLAKFLPRLPQEALYKLMEQCGISTNDKANGGSEPIRCQQKDGILTIGKTAVPVYKSNSQVKVPEVVFYETEHHVRLLESLLQDFVLGDHLLLVGNQGVGKNRIIDHLLSLMNRPREYIQLHRDTTVQSLTVQPSVRDGVVVFEDSPLVRAAREGHVLIVDEADKAPTQVTCILKTLVESGEMLLADGRRIVPQDWATQTEASRNDHIRLHPDFRMIVLANRPGFPFLGNDFFAALGDLFSVHTVDNPTVESELTLLQNYAPSLKEGTLRTLVAAFSDLRNLSDQGLLSYPYSTREVINIAKHLEKYPSDGIVQAVSNVFDFDSYSPEVKETVTRIFHKQGIPVGASVNNVALAEKVKLELPVPAGTWKFSLGVPSSPSHRSLPTILESALRLRAGPIERTDTRLLWFTEQQGYWNLPLGYSSSVLDFTVDSIAIATDETEKKKAVFTVANNPAALYVLLPEDDVLMEVSLEECGLLTPSTAVARIASRDNGVLIFNPDVERLLHIDWTKRSCRLFDLNQQSALGKLGQRLVGKMDRSNQSAVAFGPKNSIVWFQNGNTKIDVVDVSEEKVTSYDTGVPVRSIRFYTDDQIIIEESKTNKKFLLNRLSDNFSPIAETSKSGDLISNFVSIKEDRSLFATESSLANLAEKRGNQELNITTWPEKNQPKIGNISIIADKKLVVRSIERDSGTKDDADGYIQIIDLNENDTRKIAVPQCEPDSRRRYANKIQSALRFLTATSEDSSIFTIDSNGRIRHFEVESHKLAKSLNQWKSTVGGNFENLTIQRPSSGPVSSPKVGKVDPTGNPHVGGNQWAGGTGGRDTAGLGGKGGPYRLDAGHQVHQVPDEEKDAVPAEVKKAAREMAQKAYKERLEQIKMSQGDAELYEQLAASVRKQVQALRVILGNVQAKSKERQWLRHQTSGEIDDSKLIEGLTGEKNIFRRRAEREPEMGHQAEKPKHLRLLVDVSGSMYRFNGYDRRLEREMAATLLFMEALQGHESQWRYDIIGHSGETLHLDLVSAQHPPQNEKQRLEVLLNMHAHSQFCLAGDHTLEATTQSISSLAQSPDIDQAFVIVLSDANLSRYGIPPHLLGQALVSSPTVKAAAVFIGSLGDQAARLSREMPPGCSYVCMDLEKLPQILQQIFTSVLLTS